MSLTSYNPNQLPARWSLNDFGRYLSFQAYRMYFWLRHNAPILVKTQLQQMERNVINDLPFVSPDGKRDIKRWLGHYDPSHFQGNIAAVRQEHGVYENGNKGIKIYVTFVVRNLKDVACKVAIYFYLSDGTKLWDYNGSYCTNDGQVSVGRSFTPSFDDCRFTDFVLFIPLSELHVANGNYDLCFDIELYDERSNTHFAISPDYYHFNYWSNS